MLMALPKQNTQFRPQPLHFVIIGGGICGLSTAIALLRTGHRVTVLEKNDLESWQKGISGGCRIAPNLYKILCEWGLRAELQKISTKPDGLNILSYRTGAYLGSFRWDQEVLKETRGEFGLTTYAALRALLYRTALNLGASVRFGAKVVSVNVCSACPFVTLSRGVVICADVLVGADGIDGMTRRYISSSRPSLAEQEWDSEGFERDGMDDTGIQMFSVSIPKRVIIDDPKLANLLDRRNSDVFVWIGHEHSAVGFTSGCDFSLCVYGSESGRHSQNLRYVLREAEPTLRRLSRLGRFSSSNQVCTPLVHEQVIEKWVEGNLVVIGEAAHPLPLGSVQSCALSVEDGAVLAKLFTLRRPSQISSLKPYVSTLLAAFQSIRYPRCSSVQTREVGIVHYMTMPGASNAEPDVREQWMRARRDGFGTMVLPVDGKFEEEDDSFPLVRQPTTPGNAPEMSPEWVEVAEIFSYEAEEEAEEWWVTWGRFQMPGIWTEASEGMDNGTLINAEKSGSRSISSLFSFPYSGSHSCPFFKPSSFLSPTSSVSTVDLKWKHITAMDHSIDSSDPDGSEGDICCFLI